MLKNRLAIKASSTSGLTIVKNSIYSPLLIEGEQAFQVEDCSDVMIKANQTFLSKKPLNEATQ